MTNRISKFFRSRRRPPDRYQVGFRNATGAIVGLGAVGTLQEVSAAVAELGPAAVILPPGHGFKVA